MPQIEAEVRSTVAVDVGVDANGAHLKAGDDVVLKLRVTRVVPYMDRQTGEEAGQRLELGRVLPNGYVEHFLVLDATLATLLTKTP